MPYTYYTKVTRDDVLAIRAYLNTVPAVHNPVKADQLPFPLNIRISMAAWNKLNFSRGRSSPTADKSARMESRRLSRRGPRRIAALCHTPKNFLGADKTSERARLCLAGLVRARHHRRSAPRPRLVVGRRHRRLPQDRAQPNHAGNGPMAETLNLSTSQMTDADLKAIATYLKDRPGDQHRTAQTRQNAAQTRRRPPIRRRCRPARRSTPTNAPAAIQANGKGAPACSRRSPIRRSYSKPIRRRSFMSCCAARRASAPNRRRQRRRCRHSPGS